MDNFEESPEVEFSAGLVIRTVILDFFMGLNGFSKHTTAKEANKPYNERIVEIEEFCNRIFADGLKWTVDHFKQFKDFGLFSEQELENAFAGLAGQYSAFLDRKGNDAPMSKFSAPDSNKKLFIALASNSKLKELSKNYETYAFYSKYEHFSIMSYGLMRRPSTDQLKTLKKAIELIVLHLYISTNMLREYLPQGDEFIKSANAEIGEYINKSIGSKDAPSK